jgi:hypothetical protein
MMTRPFRILGIQQIAIGGPDKQRLRSLWVDILGLEVKSTFVSERENVDEDICALGSGPMAVEVDLMQPLDPDKKPAVHTTPLNHVGLWVDDLPLAVQTGVSADVASGNMADSFKAYRPSIGTYNNMPIAAISNRSDCMARHPVYPFKRELFARHIGQSLRSRHNFRRCLCSINC